MSELPLSWQEHDRKVRPYVLSHRWVSWIRRVVLWGLTGYFLLTPKGRNWEWVLNGYIESPFLLWIVYFGMLAVIVELISFPFSVAGYQIERRYELSRQSLGSWLWDKVKGWIVGGILAGIALALVYLSVTRFGPQWWIVCASLFLLFSILLAQLAPVLLIPLFFKLKPMGEGPLKERLLGLCARHGVEVKDVYHLGLGEKTEKGNAAFVGLGRTKRILIGDTLYQKYPPEQIEAVFAHELGHQVHNDLWKGIGFSSVLLYLGFFLADWISLTWALAYFDTSLDRPFGVLVFFAVLTVLQWPMGVLSALYSRSREWAADAFAAKRIQLAAPLADALERLTLQNFSEFRPNRFIEFFTYSHPAPWRRILKLRAR